MNQELDSLFRAVFNQETRSAEEYTPLEIQKRNKKKNVTSNNYKAFLAKYDDLENTIDDFKPMDFMYYFREKSHETGHRYTIANMKRDLGIFKKLCSNYNSKEICLMIEFIFCEEQEYINKDEVQPTILASSMVNSIFSNSMLWANDEYVPYSKRKKSFKLKTLQNREWEDNAVVESAKEDNAEIGVWE